MPPQFNGEKTDDVVIKENRMLQANHYLELVSLYYWCAHIAVSIWLMVVCVCVCVCVCDCRPRKRLRTPLLPYSVE
jgi:hypothetical protein